MPVGDTQAAFLVAADKDRIELTNGPTVPWVCEQGHFGLLRVAEVAEDDEVKLRAMVAADALERIFLRLGGDLDCLRAGRTNSLRGDFLHIESQTLIEIDEFQHLTSFRLRTFDEYPADLTVGYDMPEYRRACRAWSSQADKYRASKEARCFGVGGRQRQRAYYDALRDLAAPAMGYAPIIRVPAPHGDGSRAYRENRDRIRAAVGVAD